MIAAVAENGVIGRNNALPWHLPADLRHFRRLTLGRPVLLGRRNYESIGRPLAQRTNIVLTRRQGYRAPGCIVVHSLADALQAAEDAAEVFIAGGAVIYAQALAQAQRFYLTRVHADVPGDTVFPGIDWSQWREVARERHEADGAHPYAYSFITLERTGAAA